MVKLKFLVFSTIFLMANNTANCADISKSTINCQIKDYITINIDSSADREAFGTNQSPYDGPISFDIDPNRNIIYLASYKYIMKVAPDGRILWKTYAFPILDIKFYNNEIYSFNGVNILHLSSDNGMIVDTIDLKLASKDIWHGILKVCKFYGDLLVIPPKGHYTPHVYDLKSKMMLSSLPEEMKKDPPNPINNCGTCDSSFIYSLFSTPEKEYEDQTDNYILFAEWNNKTTQSGLYIYSKINKTIQMLNIISFKRKLFLGMAVHSCLFISDSEFICSEIVWKNSGSVQIKYYKITIPIQVNKNKIVEYK